MKHELLSERSALRRVTWLKVLLMSNALSRVTGYEQRIRSLGTSGVPRFGDKRYSKLTAVLV
jgi:hypothetical protein